MNSLIVPAALVLFSLLSKKSAAATPVTGAVVPASGAVPLYAQSANPSEVTVQGSQSVVTALPSPVANPSAPPTITSSSSTPVSSLPTAITSPTASPIAPLSVSAPIGAYGTGGTHTGGVSTVTKLF